MYCRSWRKKSSFSIPHGPTNEQIQYQSGQCSVTIAQFPQRPTIWPCSRKVTRSTSFTGPLLTSSVSSTSNAYTTIAVSSSHSVGIVVRSRSSEVTDGTVRLAALHTKLGPGAGALRPETHRERAHLRSDEELSESGNDGQAALNAPRAAAASRGVLIPPRAPRRGPARTSGGWRYVFTLVR